MKWKLFFCFVLKVQVEAYDSRSPESSAVTVNITVNVYRNQNAPVFANAAYSMQIDDIYPIGNIILNVTATDQDGVSWFLPANFLEIIRAGS